MDGASMNEQPLRPHVILSLWVWLYYEQAKNQTNKTLIFLNMHMFQVQFVVGWTHQSL